MAMLALLILSALVVGFSVLSATEPTIANNQLMVAQARSLAEAGVERAVWALHESRLDSERASLRPTRTDPQQPRTTAVSSVLVSARERPAWAASGVTVAAGTGRRTAECPAAPR